jgi:hypothetical protein
MHRDSCPQPEIQPSRRCRCIGRAIYSILPIVVTLMLLPTIAFATPPDQLWIAGIYDGADGDDIVTLVYETAGVEAASTRPAPQLPRSSEILLVSGPSTLHGLPACQSTRGPPTSPVLIFYSVRLPLQLLAALPASCVTQRNLLSTPSCPRRIEEASRSVSLRNSPSPRNPRLLGPARLSCSITAVTLFLECLASGFSASRGSNYSVALYVSARRLVHFDLLS